MAIFEGIRDRAEGAVEELEHATSSPNVRSVDTKVSTVRTGGSDQHELDERKIERYWELYQEVPLVREPIRAFAGEVVAPGYWIETESEEAREDLEDWLAHSCVVEGEVDKNFREILKKATIQREVKGSALIEKVPMENGEGLYGFKLIKPETVRAYTYPGQSVLLDPDDDPTNIKAESQATFPKTFGRESPPIKDGKPAAYVQFDEELGFEEKEEIKFTRDQIIKLTRDSDAGEIFGESRLTAVERRLESLLKKLEDNDRAIESLAHPLQIFKFGTGDSGPWEEEKMVEFMNEHDPEDFEPGMKQGVQGDIDVDTVSGEVAEIDEFLKFDVDWIISTMPLPKYALGGFEQDVNQFVSRSQETRVENQIKEARKEMEDEWTPVIQEKAEELGHDADDVQLRISTPPEVFEAPEGFEVDEDGNLVPEGDGENVGEGGTDFTRPPASSEEDRVQNEQDEEQ